MYSTLQLGYTNICLLYGLVKKYRGGEPEHLKMWFGTKLSDPPLIKH